MAAHEEAHKVRQAALAELLAVNIPAEARPELEKQLAADMLNPRNDQPCLYDQLQSMVLACTGNNAYHMLPTEVRLLTTESHCSGACEYWNQTPDKSSRTHYTFQQSCTCKYILYCSITRMSTILVLEWGSLRYRTSLL